MKWKWPYGQLWRLSWKAQLLSLFLLLFSLMEVNVHVMRTLKWPMKRSMWQKNWGFLSKARKNWCLLPTALCKPSWTRPSSPIQTFWWLLPLSTFWQQSHDILSQNYLANLFPKFITHRDYEMINIYCFKRLSCIVICCAVIKNTTIFILPILKQ